MLFICWIGLQSMVIHFERSMCLGLYLSWECKVLLFCKFISFRLYRWIGVLCSKVNNVSSSTSTHKFPFWKNKSYVFDCTEICNVVYREILFCLFSRKYQENWLMNLHDDWKEWYLNCILIPCFALYMIRWISIYLYL